MNKTMSISIDHKKFDLDEEAFQLLDNYLASVKKHFASHENREEILADIENSIAAKLIEKLGKHKQVITKEDVQSLIKTMGTIEDFEEFEPHKKATNEPEMTPIKKLYRNPDDRILGGVASGLAMHFNLDPTLVRVLFVLTTVFWGFGLIVYLILWLVVPEAKTAAQKIEMRGGKTTLANIESSQPNPEQLENRKRVRKILGIFLIIISGVTIFLGFFIPAFILSHNGLPPLFILSILALFISPFLFLLYLGIKLVKNKEISKTMVILLIIAILLYLIFISPFRVVISPFVPSFPNIDIF
jgi:phage shock protein PspC (stress-responsive transcriptional regulator)